jgi:deoxyribodipyrimidine photolyase
MSYSMVWFKRDLRWEDHEALAQAAKSGDISGNSEKMISMIQSL